MNIKMAKSRYQGCRRPKSEKEKKRKRSAPEKLEPHSLKEQNWRCPNSENGSSKS
jgi:hypothetical protein